MSDANNMRVTDAMEVGFRFHILLLCAKCKQFYYVPVVALQQFHY